MAAAPLPIPDDDLAPAPAVAHLAGRKRALEQLLRERRLQREAPPLRGEDRRLRPLRTGVAAVDSLLGSGFPRGQLSEMHGPASSGRTALLLGLLAQVTSCGALAALVDPLDSLDPTSAVASGVDLARLLWLRGRNDEELAPKALADATAAVATLAGSGLFEVVALDLVRAGRAVRGLPSTTWLRLQRLVEETPTALLLLAEGHLAFGPGGTSLALEPTGATWSGQGPSRLLRSLAARARAGRHGLRTAELALPALA
jgi:hypothetical protein